MLAIAWTAVRAMLGPIVPTYEVVRVGVKGEGMVEVVDGLAEGEAVLPSSVQSVAPGQRVRPRATAIELARVL